MNINNEESIETVLLHVDHAINFGEDVEPRVRLATGCFVCYGLSLKFCSFQEPKDLDMDE